ncbi:ATP-grasp fold amidoligase family protein [Clostridium tertium]|uniref:ATP-grasp fold amidoligase family protein n=1 Tax=Clostridium tertium TaxID=1559 RepID=UPI003DA2B3C2
MSNTFKKLYRSILCKLPDVPAIYLIYFRGYKKILNLKNPKYFGEKIQWLKLYGNLDKLSQYVDKYEVRKFIKSTIGSKYLNKLYGLYESPEEINFETLPNQFVLKCTNGSGGVLICKDKSKLDISKAKKEMNKWIQYDFYKMKKEPQYKNIKNRLIAEEYLEDESGSLRDYKFYCFDGKAYYYLVLNDRYAEKTIDTYDISGNKLEYVKNSGVKTSDYVLPQSENFMELVRVVEKLAKPFQFVRVDFYIVKDKIYFGELTFTDGAGSDPFSPLSFDLEMAKRIKLGKILLNERK